MAAAGVPMRTLQEWMGHRDIETTQRYADYAPSAREAEMDAAPRSAAAGPDATPPNPRETMVSTQRLRDTDRVSELRARLAGEQAELGRVPAADVARLILLVERATARAASVVLGRPKTTTGRYQDVIERAARFALRSVEAGSVVPVLELPEPPTSDDDTLDIEVASLSERAVAALLDAAHEVDPHPVIARALLELADGMHVGDRYEAVTLGTGGSTVESPRTAVIDRNVRIRLRTFIESREAAPTRPDSLTGVLVEADFEKRSARLRTAAEPAIQVAFTDDLADQIQAALRQPATLRGDVEYDPSTHVARSVSPSVVERGEQLVFGVDPDAFWVERTFDELAREQDSGKPVDPESLFDEDATEDERDALMAALEELG